MMDMDGNKLAHFTMILTFLELKVTEKLEVGFVLNNMVVRHLALWSYYV